jgi:hypothetical protein
MPESRHSSPTGGLRLRGAAVPAALVGVSVLLVLIVVAVSALMGDGRASVIPLGGGSASADDQGQVLDGQTQAGTAGSPSLRSSRKPSPSTRSVPPTQPVAATTAAAAPPLRPVTIEAETATFGGSAAKSTCSTCSAGAKVRYVGGTGANSGTVTFSGLTVPASANYHLTIGCELGDDLHGPFVVTLNGGTTVQATCPKNSWSTMTTTTLVVPLQVGANSIRFGNVSANAPDLDRITLAP